jgi:hypothetical protein
MSDETQVTPDQTTETTVDATPVETESKVHPAHEKLLAELPEAWHAKVTPHLQEQDKYFQQQIEKYTPFKDYVEQGVSPDLILGGLNLARAIESNPQEVFESLRDYLGQQGLLPEEAAQAAVDFMESEADEDAEDIFDAVPAELRREIEELKQFRDQQEEIQYYQELEKETDRYTYELETEISDLKSRFNISEAHEIAMYDLMNAALNAGREISLAEAAQQLQSMVGPFAPTNGQAYEPAPTIIGSAGGAGVVAPNLQIPKDDKGKKEMLAQMFEEYRKANQ